MSQISPQSLVKMLINLRGLKAARLAAASGIRSPNLYNWFAGRSQTLSGTMVETLMQTLGVIDNQLSHQVIHCWQVDASLEEIKLVLKRLVDIKMLSQSEIYYIDCGNRHYFNLIRIPNTDHKDIVLLLSTGKIKGDGYPLNANTLGFGVDKGKVDLPYRVWDEWWFANPPMLSTDFWISAMPYVSNVVEVKSPAIAENNLINMQIEYERQIKEQVAVNAGLRGLVRALLGEVRKLDDKNLFLKHNKRDQVFDDYYHEELDKVNRKNGKLR